MALTDTQWAEVKKAYESGESEASLSKRYGADRKTIRAHRKRENWTPHVIPHVGKAEQQAIHERTTANVIDIATGRALQQMDKAGTIKGIAAALEAGLAKHASIASRLMDAADKLLIDFVNDKDSELASTREGSGRDVVIRQGRAELFNQLVSGVRNAVAVSRDIAGIRPGVPSTGDNDTTDDLFRFEDAVDTSEAV